ncbi:TPA: hypothetical protein ACGUW2_000043 [Vibrio vulnificus]|nr:hypothetical protein [Vibrio vulnificus]HDY8028957.1 hypothetical protein [Vibrio vulnificus]HDY8033487.1 hypothetical protein [Vibrio vulnificus]
MKKVSVKIESVNADCPHCGAYQHIDISEFSEALGLSDHHFKAFVEYKTYCHQCDKYFEFELDVL